MPRSAVAPAAPARAQRAHELGVERSLRVARLLAAVDHQLLPHRQPRRVGGRDRLGHRQAPAVALADAHALEGDQRLGQQRAQLGQRRGDALAGADRHDHQRHLRVGGEEARAPALAAHGAVDAQQDGGAGDAVAMQRVDDGDVRGPAAGALAAPEVDGELGLLVRRRPRAAASGMRARSRVMSPSPRQRHDLVERRLDARARVDGDGDHRQVLGERQQPVGVQVVLDPEALDAAHDEARAQPVAGVEVDERIGQEALARAVALAEVGRQLQASVGHSAAPEPVSQPHARRARAPG